MIKIVKNMVQWTYAINDFNGKETVGSFYVKELQKDNLKSIYNWKSNQEKGDKLYGKLKDCDSSFNSWIGKKNIV